MFTGIIEATAKIIEARDDLLIIERPASFIGIKGGSSIAVSGVCLSVEELNKKSIRFSVVPETLRKSTIGSFKEGNLVNLERAMRADARLDGHIVQGHIEGVGEVVSVSTSSPQPPPPLEEGELSLEEKEDKWLPKPVPSNTKFFARTMRSEPTAAELLLWDCIRRDRLGVRFRRQYVLEGQILDFYCPARKIAVEVDGGIHNDKLQKKSDKERDQFLLEEHGIRTIRITNQSIFSDVDAVVAHLEASLQNNTQHTFLSSGGGGVRGGGILEVRIPRPLLPTIVLKGSIALDGASLTVASINGDQITVALIPHTLKHTTLGSLQPGDQINIETDVLARHASPPSFRTSRPAKKLSEVRVGIVYSQWYPEIVERLRASAIREFMKQGIAEGNISEHPSPGSFEIPLIGRNLAQEESVDALIALGVIVEGETHHADLIAREAARGCMDIQVHYGIPFGFEILYVDDIALAQARRERGEEAARAVLAVLREKMEN